MSIPGPTPEQSQEIDRVVAEFDKDWQINRAAFEICRKPISWLQKVRQFIKPRKHNVFALYWWCRRKFHGDPQLVGLGFPIRCDNLPVPGHAMKYELLGNWKIPKKDLVFLKAGPLLAANGSTVLVEYDARLVKLKRLAREWGSVFTIAAAVLTITARLLEIF